MKKFRDYIILFLFLTIFILIFKYNDIVKNSVISSSELWFFNLVPFMFPMYIIVDLLINYGLADLLYRVFKKNTFILVLISALLGTPSNAKYIKEFYDEGLISKNIGNYLLLFSYSPNPLFILGISPSVKVSIAILLYIYITNALLAFIFKHKFDLKEKNTKSFQRVSFSECIERSITKSFNILILILGIVTIYGIVNTLISLIGMDSVFLSSILELTNAIDIILKSGESAYWIIFAVSFGGFSIHTQIKSILEATSLSYRYFLLGRILSSIPILLFLCFY